jgi:ParB-like chromosome segregation protein Spo0J
MKIKNIPLSQLVPPPDNVRKTGSMNGIAGLAANIEAKGLLQNLQVRPAANGTFEVVAGGRRLAALKLLAKKKALAKDAPIACNLLAKDEDAAEIRACVEITAPLDRGRPIPSWCGNAHDKRLCRDQHRKARMAGLRLP